MAKPLRTNIYPTALAAYDGYIYTVGTNYGLFKLSTSEAIPNGSAIPIVNLRSITNNGALFIKYITIHVYTTGTTVKKGMYISVASYGNATIISGLGKIYFIPDLDNPVLSSLTIFASDLNAPRGLQVYNNHLYVVTTTLGLQTIIIQFDLANSANRSEFNLPLNNFLNPEQLVITDNYLYIIDTYQYKSICRVGLINNFPSVSAELDWVDLNSYYYIDGILVSYGNFIYFSHYTSSEIGYMVQIDILTKAIINNNYLPDLSSQANNKFNCAVIYDNRFYIDFSYSSNLNYTLTSVIYNLPIYTIKIPCFKEDTKILTDMGYVPIQDLHKGDLIKTLKSDYKAIDMIGKREIYHIGIQERIKDQLYKCSEDNFDEIFEPLIITGCHSILVDEFIDEEQKQKVIEVNGNIYITDNKYRVPACADSRTSVYEKTGTYTIYHLALENEDYYMNYGIYANGLLVETCSKRYLKELSNMTLIE